MTPADYITAARVPLSLRLQRFGLWEIARVAAGNPAIARYWGAPEVTLLRRTTMATLHKGDYGDIVMEDSQWELRRHLPIWLPAHGRVLVTGLGLGCVVRGLLAKPEVEHIDVVEIDAGIIRVVGSEFSGDQRVKIHHADALTWPPMRFGRWDFAWHDLCDADDGVHLQRLHVRLLARFRGAVGQQGAWALPRWVHRVTRREKFLGGPRS